MAKSLRSTPGQKQQYNLYDPDDIYRAQKAINERINDIAKTFGADSQIYRDYIAPMTVGSLAPHVRIDKYGLTKFKTGKNNQNADVSYVLERMLGKSTAGEILQRTAEQMDKALNIQHAKATGKKIARRDEIITAARGLHDLELDVYGRLDEMYDLAEEKLGSKEKAKEYINKRFKNRKFMKDIHASHGELTRSQLEYMNRYFDKNWNLEEFMGFEEKKKKEKPKEIRGRLHQNRNKLQKRRRK